MVGVFSRRHALRASVPLTKHRKKGMLQPVPLGEVAAAQPLGGHCCDIQSVHVTSRTERNLYAATVLRF